METNILLENGTNEVEILEFTLGENHYGINVAKIREILQYQPVTPIPNAHYYVKKIFMPHNIMITIINLKKNLNLITPTLKGANLGLFRKSNYFLSILAKTFTEP